MKALLRIAFGDTLEVLDEDTLDRFGEIAPSCEDEWAAYRAQAWGQPDQRRMGTYASAELAVAALIADRELRR